MGNSNSSFASRLRRAQDISAILKGLEDYNPPNVEDSLAGFQAYIDSLVEVNNSETSLMKAFRLAAGHRRDRFFNDPDSAIRLMAALKTGVKMQYGRNSYELALLKTISERMQYAKVAVPTVNTDEATVPDSSEPKKSIRHAERNFGSITKNFNDFITTIEGFNSYKPATDGLTLENLRRVSQDLTSLNDDVAVKLGQLQDAKKNRAKLYLELKERAERIKSYLRVKYKADSNIYLKVRSYRF